MKKAMLGGEGKSDVHSMGKPKEIMTHITNKDTKPNIFNSPVHPKVSGKMANCSGSKMC